MNTLASEVFQYIIEFFKCYMNEFKLRFPWREIVRLVILGVVFLMLLLSGVAISNWSAGAVM